MGMGRKHPHWNTKALMFRKHVCSKLNFFFYHSSDVYFGHHTVTNSQDLGILCKEVAPFTGKSKAFKGEVHSKMQSFTESMEPLKNKK